ncbi:MAG: hypothetical protein ABEI98_04525 [Halorhabdus sp.]
MVDNRITDGDRIAELLRAELDGRETGELDRLSVESATVRVDGRPLAKLEPRESGLELTFSQPESAIRDAIVGATLESHPGDQSVTVVVASAAETKRAVDLLVAVSSFE